MSQDTKTHDVAVATQAAKPVPPTKPADPPPAEAKSSIDAETAPKQVQPEGR